VVKPIEIHLRMKVQWCMSVTTASVRVD